MAERKEYGTSPAYPQGEEYYKDDHCSRKQRHAKAALHEGWTQRQDAAIRLGVPDSGLQWLDAMIEKSRRDAFVGQVLCGDMAWAGMAGVTDSSRQAAWAIELANAAIAETGKQVPNA